MTNVTVIGAGVSGPAAALALADAGHCVTLYERRPENEITSWDVIGITHANVAALEAHGANMASVELPSFFTDWNDGKPDTHRFLEEGFYQWTDLHRVILAAAKAKGVKCRFGTDWEGRPSGVTVQASGVGYAAWSGLHSRYTGQVVYQGLSTVDTDWSWLNVTDDQKRFDLKLAHTPANGGGSSWSLFVHRPHPDMRSVVLNPCNGADLPDECADLPGEFREITRHTVKLAVRPLSDWTPPKGMIRNDCITIGDANGAMRPQSAMGANLGIAEALCVPYIVNRPDNDNETVKALLANRRKFARIGAQRGRAVLGS